MLSIAATPVLALVLGAGAAPPSPNAGDAARLMALDRFASGRDALSAKRWADAEKEFGDAVRLQPGLALAHYGLGQALMGQARYAEAVVTYQQTIRQAFREVSDAIVGYSKIREFRGQQALLVASAQDARRLADVRYQGGATSYLEVLDADTRLFVAQLGLAQAQLNELLALVQIYRALGGGWEQ